MMPNKEWEEKGFIDEPATVAPDINACMDALIAIFCFYFVLFNSFSTLVLVPCLLNR